MKITEKRLIPYTNEQGRQPVIDWLENLDKKTRTRITSRFSRIALGNYGDCKSLDNEIRELRFDFGPGYRIYFGEDGDKIIILLIGGDKSTQKKDIKQAKEYWIDYINRGQEHV